MTHPAILVEGLVKAYGSRRAVDNLSCRVERGEVYGLLGPNGAGKTTTVECMEGLREPDQGSIQILGMRHRDQGTEIKARLGVQLQSTGLFPRLSVRELIDLYAAFFPRSLPTDQLLSLTGLTERQQADPATLSGGWRQRVTLALALVNDPEILFLDEPTTGMDPASRREVWGLIRTLQKQGKTVLLTTHNMEEAAYLCDRVAVIDRGRVIAEGRPHELVRAHFAETAIEFATPDALPVARLQALPGVSRLVTEPASTTLYSTQVPETVAGLLQLSREENLRLDRFTVREATLEDLFLRLTGRRLETSQEEGIA